MSGVLAALAASLVVGNVGWTGWMGCSISPAGRDHLVSFWEYAAFLANSIVFILIGGHEANQASRLFTPAHNRPDIWQHPTKSKTSPIRLALKGRSQMWKRKLTASPKAGALGGATASAT